MATICQKIDKAISLAQRPLDTVQLSNLTEVEVEDLTPTLKRLIQGGLMRVDSEGKFYRPVSKAEGF